ncbi:DUF1761 domain-containing protein [Rhodohalobacter sulfatireducens]|uniref:DUF1761 domain-containing protein n=1 Tax=Rhodohalobacter sulfatireducens TaxID=2911366 RepID=A0ABS9KEQ9_9BACT|nr:DUF1761 domain-containing protein [Rhodohalobacter sulfatireducens]MCG2589311.1 DUF1761 domain-containing protein [Rhodohalobacter sulfatireducens]
MSDLLFSLNWFSIIVATLVYFILGALWYSPVLFGNTWMKLRNLDPETMEQPNPIIYFYSFILQFIGVASLAMFITALGVDGAGNGALIGFGAGAGFVFSLAGATGIFTDIPMKLHFLDNGYHVVGLVLAGIILGLW